MLWHIRRYAVAYPKNNGIDLELTIASVRELIANCVHGKIARQAVPPLCGRTDEGIRFRRHRDSAGSRFIALAHAIIAAERGLVAFVITNRVKLLRSMSTRYQKDNRRKSIPQLPARTLSLSLSLSLSASRRASSRKVLIVHRSRHGRLHLNKKGSNGANPSLSSFPTVPLSLFLSFTLLLMGPVVSLAIFVGPLSG